MFVSIGRFAAVLSTVVFGSALAHANTITFDTYTSGTSITTQYSGLAVSGGTIYTPGSGQTAAHSGSNELINSSGSPLILTFSDPQSVITAYYTSATGMSVSAFRAGSSSPILTTNFGAASTQTAFSITGSNITQLTFSPVSGTVTLDDLNYTAPASQTAATPEPASLLLMGTGFFFASIFPAWRAAQRRALTV